MEKELTLSEIRDKKSKLDFEICKLIKDFRDETDTIVENIRVNYVNTLNDEGVSLFYINSVTSEINYDK